MLSVYIGIIQGFRILPKYWRIKLHISGCRVCLIIAMVVEQRGLHNRVSGLGFRANIGLYGAPQ